MMKKFFSLLILLLLCFAFAAVQNESKTFAQTNPVYTNYTDCIRMYKLPYEKLYALSLSAVNAHKYTILEIQSRNGYAMFDVNGKEFLLSVLKKDKTYSFLKIAPADNNYLFSPTIPQKIFNYVDLNFNAELKELKF